MRPPLELKKTLNLPKTDFSMKANLPQNEPKWLETLGEDGYLPEDSRVSPWRAKLCPA